MAFTPKQGANQSLPPRRKVQRTPITSHEAKRQALHLPGEQLSPLQSSVLAALAAAGVLTDALVLLTGGSEWSQRRYYKQHLLDRLPTHG